MTTTLISLWRCAADGFPVPGDTLSLSSVPLKHNGRYCRIHGWQDMTPWVEYLDTWQRVKIELSDLFYLDESPEAMNEMLAADVWFRYSQKYPPLGVEVLAKSASWVSEYNPHGIRVGFQNLECDSDGEFISAKYNNTSDTYFNDETLPEYWKFINSRNQTP